MELVEDVQSTCSLMERIMIGSRRVKVSTSDIEFNPLHYCCIVLPSITQHFLYAVLSF